MRIFLTGATGFIGQSILVYPAFKDHELVCWKREGGATPDVSIHPSASIVVGDISASLINGCDTVLNFAGRAHRMKETSVNSVSENKKINCEFTLDLARASLAAGVKRFVHLSTVKVMGDGNRGGKVMNENDSPAPEDPYGQSKLEAEKGLAELFSKQKKAKCVILRFPMVYGPGNKGNMLSLLKMASKGVLLPLGAVKLKRSMVYVENVCGALKRVIEDNDPSRPFVQTYFINDGCDLSSKELYSRISREYSGKKGTFYLPAFILRLGGAAGSLVEKASGIRLPLNRNVVSRLFNEYRFSSAAFRRDYDWSPPYTTEEGIKETVEWHRSVNN